METKYTILVSGVLKPSRMSATQTQKIVNDEADLDTAMDLIRMSHHHFAGKQSALPVEQA